MEPLEKILTAATELFSQYGFKTITMDDVARHAGISKRTLYLHFANKEEVVHESVVQHKKLMGESCQTILNCSENAVEAMVKTMAFFDDMHKRVNPMAIYELQRFFPEAYKTFRSILEVHDVAMFKDNLEKGIQQGLYRPTINSEMLARYRLETALLVFQPNLMVNDRNSLMQVQLEIAEHFMFGIVTPKGEQLYITYKAKYLNTQ